MRAPSEALKDVELVSVCDTNLSGAQSFCRELGRAGGFSSLEAMLRDQRLDAVHVLAPPDQHHAIAEAALRSGAHVFLEKPMCTSVEEAEELLQTARESGLKIGVNHNFLYSAAYERLRRLFTQGRSGHWTTSHSIISSSFHKYALARSTHGCCVLPEMQSWKLVHT